MDINQLKYFKAVADTGKIVSAAELMFVTPPAISSSLAGLEKELGMPLFIRRGNRLILNRQGEIFLDYVNYILYILTDAKTDLLESLSEEPNHIVLGVTSSNIMVDLITSFSIEHPEISLSTATINVKDINPAGLNRRFSFLLAAEGDPPEDYVNASKSIYLFDDTLMLMVSPEHPFAKVQSVEPQELAGERLILPRGNANVHTQILSMFAKRGLPAPVFSIHNQLICHSLVSRNAGVAITTARARNCVSNELCFVPLNAPECRWPYRLYWQKSRELTEEDQTFLDFVKEFYDL